MVTCTTPPFRVAVRLNSGVSAYSRTVAITLHRSYDCFMSELNFEWDPAKAAANLKKHGIDFAEAKSAFADEQAKIIPDPDHSEDEERFILLGLSLNLKLLVVCHCYREKNNSIRIISARKATKPESRQY